MLRARPLPPLAAGVVAGIALAALLSIRWRHPVLLAVLGLGLGGLDRSAGATSSSWARRSGRNVVAPCRRTKRRS